MKRKNFWDVRPSMPYRVAKANSSGNDGTNSGQERSLVPLNDGDQQNLGRDLSLGGAVLLGLGAKQVLLPALALSHPLLLAVTVPTTLFTGRRYLRSLWDVARRKEGLNREALAATATVVSLVSGGTVTALAGVGVLNLGKYLAQEQAPNENEDEDEDEDETLRQALPLDSLVAKYAPPASLALGGLIFAPHLITLIPSVEQTLIFTNIFIAKINSMPYTPLLYLGAYSLTPFILLPTALMSIAGGLLFGPYWGLVYSLIGNSAAAMVAYMIGHYFGEQLELEEEQSEGLIARYAERIRENPFESVLMVHLLYLPYDLFNYLAGALQLEWQPFLLATLLGSIPSTISFVLLGASIEGNAITGIPHLNPTTLAASGVIFVGSLALSRYLNQEEEEEEEENVTGELGVAL